MNQRQKNIPALLRERQAFEFQAQPDSVFQVNQSLDPGQVVPREIHPLDNAGKVTHFSEIDLKSPDTQLLERFDRDQNDLRIGLNVLSPDVLDSDLEKFALPSTARSLVTKYFAAIRQPQRFGVIGKMRSH